MLVLHSQSLWYIFDLLDLCNLCDSLYSPQLYIWGTLIFYINISFISYKKVYKYMYIYLKYFNFMLVNLVVLSCRGGEVSLF